MVDERSIFTVGEVAMARKLDVVERHDIRRYQPAVPDSYGHHEVLEEARTVLGYQPGPDGYRVNMALRELDIEKLDYRDVKSYMDSKRGNGYDFVQYPLEKYKLPVPLHVLNKAIQIKKRLPDVEFTIFSYEKVGTREGAGDPFLWAAVDGWGCYVEVWDEPEFEGRRTK